MTTANGTLTRKIQRQDACSTSQPPPSGPITNAMPVHAVHAPIAAPRSSPLKVVAITARPAGVRIAPVAPCRPAREDQGRAVGRRGAEDRGEPERRDSDQEEPPGAEEVAERAADEQQRAEGEEVGVDHPLLERETAAEVVLDGRQRHVHDRGVDEHDHRTEDASHEDQAITSFGDRRSIFADPALVAERL